ncbi:MAG: BglG family transcription antiterminator [Pseudomonadota bacterium]
MNSFTVRQKFILNNLIEKGPLTTKGLSQQMDVSERTVLREVSAINVWLKQYDLRISEGVGQLNIMGSRKNINKIKEFFAGVPLLWMLTQEQRQVLITAQLLLSKEPIKSAYFSSQFNIVEGTVIFYLDKIEGWLAAKDLKLIRRRGYGLEIIGSDWKKRNAFTELIYNYRSISELLDFLYEDNNDYSLQAFFNVTFGENLINDVKSVLKRLFSENAPMKARDVDYFSAFIHMLLSVERTRSGVPIQLPDYIVRDALAMKEASFIKDMEKALAEKNIRLPDSELAYLVIHITGDNGLFENDNIPAELGFDIDDSISEIIYLTSKRLNIGIECDRQLVDGLKQHINPALYRLTMGLEVRNPIINEIKEYYKELFNAVDHGCKLVFSKYNLVIPANEVGYITMHIGAAIERQNGMVSRLKALIICPNGISTAKILLGKLKNSFPEIDVIDVCSIREMDERIKEGYDLVLSTVKVNKDQLGEITVISPFLPDRDIDRVSGLVKDRLRAAGGHRNNWQVGFAGNTTEEADFSATDDMLQGFGLRNIDSANIREAIGQIVDYLYDSKLITERGRIEGQIIKREEKGSVVIPNSHVALIHIRTADIGTPFLGVFRLQQHIEMKSAGFSVESIDTILVMIARKSERDYILEQLGKISAALVEEESFLSILRFGDIKDIRSELIKIINRRDVDEQSYIE